MICAVDSMVVMTAMRSPGMAAGACAQGDRVDGSEREQGGRKADAGKAKESHLGAARR